MGVKSTDCLTLPMRTVISPTEVKATYPRSPMIHTRTAGRGITKTGYKITIGSNIVYTSNLLNKLFIYLLCRHYILTLYDNKSLFDGQKSAFFLKVNSECGCLLRGVQAGRHEMRVLPRAA